MKVKKNKIHFWAPVIIFIAVLLSVWLIFSKSIGGLDTSGDATLEQALERASVLCYSLEGFYPPTLAYLTDNYGVVVDKENYIVHYEAFAANQMPDIDVMLK